MQLLKENLVKLNNIKNTENLKYTYPSPKNYNFFTLQIQFENKQQPYI